MPSLFAVSPPPTVRLGDREMIFARGSAMSVPGKALAQGFPRALPAMTSSQLPGVREVSSYPASSLRQLVHLLGVTLPTFDLVRLRGSGPASWWSQARAFSKTVPAASQDERERTVGKTVITTGMIMSPEPMS
jgi:hypothetical protein